MSIYSSSVAIPRHLCPTSLIEVSTIPLVVPQCFATPKAEATMFRMVLVGGCAGVAGRLRGLTMVRLMLSPSHKEACIFLVYRLFFLVTCLSADGL